MRVGLTILALALAIGAVPRIAHAQPIQGFYADAGAGMSLPFATKVTPVASGFRGTFDFGQSPGYAARISAGYALGNGWRFELEGTIGRTSVNGIAGTSFPAASSGTLARRGLMANALFDLDVGSPYVFPYLGLGAGYQSTRLSGFTVTRRDAAFAFSASGESGGLTMQGIAGLAFPVPNMPGLSITADYRLMNTLGGLKFGGASSTGAVVSPGTAKFHNQFAQELTIGVRFAFNTPPPAGLTPPAASALQAPSYVVAFAPSHFAVDARASTIVREAARSSVKAGKTRIQIGAYGTQQTDRAMAARRANAVAAALIKDGVAREAIVITALGDTRPLVQTALGASRTGTGTVEIVLP
ncbi:MAG: hypothetical protein EXR07_04765 [Acetobacteraceae bacterium]|nr:hypothetical protein [Acetobacteraceae bacterium]